MFAALSSFLHVLTSPRTRRHRYDDAHPFDLGHAAYALGPLAGAGGAAAPLCTRLTYFTGDYDMVAQASVAVAQT